MRSSKKWTLENKIDYEIEINDLLLQEINYQKCYIKINLVINEEYSLELILFSDSGVNINCTKE